MPQSNSAPQSASNRHWGFSTAGRVFFGWGVIEELRTVTKEFGKRVMVCTDKNIMKSGIARFPSAKNAIGKRDIFFMALLMASAYLYSVSGSA